MKISFWQFFRLIFVVFSLYLMGDAFSRWDGFRYYASFSEFLPSVALASILWSLVSVLTAIFLWILLKLFKWFCSITKIKIEIEQSLLYTCVFVLLGLLVWKSKKLIWPYVQTTFSVKLAVFLSVFIISFFIVWLTRDKAKSLLSILQQKITPLVRLFGIFVLLAVPLVSYHAWFADSDKKVPAKKDRNAVTEKTLPNIIFVSFDALAAREMSLYGYQKETTPFISEWSKNATVFSNVKAGSNFTTPAVASLMTGKRVWTHQTYHIEGSKPIRSEIESLPAVLKANGYFNIALVVNPFASVNVLGMSGSFDVAPLAVEFGSSNSLFGWKFGTIDVMLYSLFGEKVRMHNWILKNDFILSKVINLMSRNIVRTPVPPERAFNRLLDIVDDGLPRPFFVWIHVFPPHDPYLPPEPFKGDGAALREYKSQEKLIEESYIYLFQHKPIPEEVQPAVDLMRSHYDEFLRYSDKQFEEFIEGINKREIENTVIILSADHGESFEHGYFTHGGPFLYEQVTHIPLIVKDLRSMKVQSVQTLVEQIDIPATILGLVNIPVPTWMEGRSLVPLMDGGELTQRPAFSMNFQGNRSRGHQITTGSLAVWDGNFKLIHNIENKENLLFNLKLDPNELSNIYDSEFGIGQRLLSLIQDNLEKANERILGEE